MNMNDYMHEYMQSMPSLPAMPSIMPTMASLPNMPSLPAMPAMPDPFKVLNECKVSSEAMATLMVQRGKSFIANAIAFNEFCHEQLNPEDVPQIAGSSLLVLSTDQLFVIFQYLSAAELAVFVTEICAPLEQCAPRMLLLLWKAHCERRWDLHIDWSIHRMSCIELRRLYPYCRKVVNPTFIGGKDMIYDGDTAEFIGTVGESNRSAMTIRGFPLLRLQPLHFKTDLMNSCSMVLRELSSAMMQGHKIKTTAPEMHAPLSSMHSLPFVCDDGIEQHVFLQPNSVAYFEVTVLPARTVRYTPSAVGDCVAVGLATKRFLLCNRLPGWDAESFGYHGDDGAIFHGQGKHLSSYGPRYGLQDTIGCGLNYADRSIFFTLNGAYLGTAFADITSLRAEGDAFFPAVGVDANHSVRFNFGMRPFRFDLRSFLLNNELTSTLDGGSVPCTPRNSFY